MLGKLVKWFFFAVAFTAVSFVVSALIYAGNQTEATFNTLAIIWCVIIFGSLFLVMLDPRQMAEDARARKAAQPKETPKTYKEPSKGLKIAGWISDIIRDFDGSRDRVSEEVMALCSRFPIYA